jgi:hypothetical protein
MKITSLRVGDGPHMKIASLKITSLRVPHICRLWSLADVGAHTTGNLDFDSRPARRIAVHSTASAAVSGRHSGLHLGRFSNH